MTSEQDRASESYNRLTALLQEVRDRTTFDDTTGLDRGKALKNANATKVKKIYGRDRMRASVMRPNMPEDLLDNLTNFLREFLKNYIVDDCIGDEINRIGGFALSKPEIKQYALRLALPTAILEAERVAELLCEWKNEKSIHCRIYAIFYGASIDELFTLKEGVNLNHDQSSFDIRLKNTSIFKNYPNIFQVEIESKIGHAFFRPDEEFTTSTTEFFEKSLLTAISRALSLASNRCVLWNVSCIDFGDLDAFREWPYLMRSFNPDDNIDLPDSNITQRQLKHARNLLDKLLTFKNPNERLILAITRWMKSKQQTNTSDSFIDLRIALEALYIVKSKQGDYSFRVANSGAWHLGDHSNERDEYREILLKAYDKASTVVHAGTVEDNEENHNLLVDSQNLCREGILKILDENGLLFDRLHNAKLWENQPATGSISDLDAEEIRQAVADAVQCGRLADPGSQDPSDLLRGLRLLCDGVLLRAAMVLFGDREQSGFRMSECCPYLRIKDSRDTSKMKHSGKYICLGQIDHNAFALLREAENYISDMTDESAYPHSAVREAIANALCHCDYSIGEGSINIELHDDRLEIISPGSLHFGLTSEELFRPHESRPWNPLIARTFYLRGIIEEWGSGTLKMVAEAKKAGLPLPEIEDNGGSVTVRFWRGRFPLQEIPILLESTEEGLTRREIHAHLSPVVNERQVRRALEVLKEKGLVISPGQGSKGQWKLAPKT